MTLLSVAVTLGVIWLNLVGLALLGHRIIGDYAVARAVAPAGACLAFFFLEHFVGLGPRLVFFPLSTAISGWLVWRHRGILRKNLVLEAAFGAGAAYCLSWRFAFPDIDLIGERIPDLVFIEQYIRGAQLPPVDVWLPPFRFDFYYSFQYYCAALMGRWFNLGSALSYSYAYAVIIGLIAAALQAALSRACSWRPGRLALGVALMAGGCGIGLVAQFTLNRYVQPIELFRYLGIRFPAEFHTAFGRFLDGVMCPPGVSPNELPVMPLSFAIAAGEFHAPLSGFLLLSIGLLLVVSLQNELEPEGLRWKAALLGATVPVTLISNAWTLPLQAVLVGSSCLWLLISGKNRASVWALIGASVATALAYPFIQAFSQQPNSHAASFEWTRPKNHSWLGWLIVFWPLLALIILGFWNRAKKGAALYWMIVWAMITVGAEIFYVHDANGATWERYNCSMKWWGWIYAGGILMVGASNLSSASRICRYGSLLVILGPCAQIYNYARCAAVQDKQDAGYLEGDHWLLKDDNLRDLVRSLRAQPDGICIESGIEFGNTEAGIMTLYAGKTALVGWPTHEMLWRNQQTDILVRIAKVEDFYAGRIEDPLAWLLANHIRYVLWLQRDNNAKNKLFAPLREKIGGHYIWRHFIGNDRDWAIGYWERSAEG